MKGGLAASIGVALCLACAGLTPPEPPEPPRPDADQAPAAPRDATCALLLNGDTHSHHTQNILSAVMGLMEAGVQPQDIFVASQPPLPTQFVPRHQTSISDQQGILYEIGLLKGCLTPSSTLVVYLTGHGNEGLNGPGINTYVALHRGLALHADTLLSLLRDELEFHTLVLAIDACYGGGFVQTFRRWDGDYVGAGPTDHLHTTYCQPFAPRFWGELQAVEEPALQRAFDVAVAGCDVYQRTGICPHSPNGCPTYRTRGQYVHQRAGEAAPDDRKR